jgi:hypothetical protein
MLMKLVTAFSIVGFVLILALLAWSLVAASCGPQVSP